MGIELQVIYRMAPDQLEPYLSIWERKWHDSGGKDINNPKIPIKFVAERGKIVYKAGSGPEQVERIAKQKEEVNEEIKDVTPEKFDPLTKKPPKQQ